APGGSVYTSGSRTAPLTYTRSGAGVLVGPGVGVGGGGSITSGAAGCARTATAPIAAASTTPTAASTSVRWFSSQSFTGAFSPGAISERASQSCRTSGPPDSFQARGAHRE